jgi:hypothetical protein
MKIVLNEKRKDNKSNTYTTILDNQPKFINDVLVGSTRTISIQKTPFYISSKVLVTSGNSVSHS